MYFGSCDDTTSKLYIFVGLMQKETVRSSKLRILQPFEVQVKKFKPIVKIKFLIPDPYKFYAFLNHELYYFINYPFEL